MQGVKVATFLLAVCGPPLLTAVAQRVLGESQSVARSLPFELALWTILAVVLVVMVRVEKQPLSSIGLRAPRPSTLVWALVLLLGTRYVFVPVATWVINRWGWRGPRAALPGWPRFLSGIEYCSVCLPVSSRNRSIEATPSSDCPHGQGVVGVAALWRCSCLALRICRAGARALPCCSRSPVRWALSSTCGRATWSR